MKNLSTMCRIRSLLLGLVWIACAGCASFSKSALPARSLSDYEGDKRLAAITYEFSDWTAVTAEDALVVTTATPAGPASVLKSQVEPIFRRTFVEATRSKEPGAWHVDMYYRETERNAAVSYTLVFLCIASLGLLPAYTQTDLYFEAKLKHGGVTVKQYIYEESVSMWVHWFMLPWAFTNDPLARKREIVDNMVLNLVHDLTRDLPPAVAAGGE